MQINLKHCALVVLVVALMLGSFIAGTHYPARITTVPLAAFKKISTQGYRDGYRSFKRLEVTPGPGHIEILGQAEVLESTTSMVYRLKLVIRDKKDERIVLKDQDKVFMVPRGRPGLLELKETRELPPGDYQVELTVLEGEQLMEGVSGRTDVTVK